MSRTDTTPRTTPRTARLTGLLTALALTSTLLGSPAAAQDTVAFGDPDLQAAVNRQLADDLGTGSRRPDQPVTRTEASRLTRLWVYQSREAKISDLTGLEHFTELTSLSIDGWLDGEGEVEDLTPLAGLTELTSLSLGDNRITDLTPLAGLTDLETLVLDRVTPTEAAPLDLAPLAGLARLRYLSATETRIEDLAPLAGLTRLRHLSLRGNPVEDLSPLARLHGLDSLHLGSAFGRRSPTSAVRDFTPLTGLPNLRVLYLEYAGGGSVDARQLAGLISVTDLWVNGDQVRHADALGALDSLTHLRLSEAGLSRAPDLTGLTDLGYLDLSANGIADFSPVIPLVSGGTGPTVITGGQQVELGPLVDGTVAVRLRNPDGGVPGVRDPGSYDPTTGLLAVTDPEVTEVAFDNGVLHLEPSSVCSWWCPGS